MSKFTPIVIVLLALALFSCRRQQDVFNQGVTLKFSADTVFLDTVIETVGSSTYTLKVYNPTDERLEVDNIRLERGNASAYRLNVDGRATKNINNVEILPEDSIYIFVEVTAPDINTPDPLYTDRILFFNKGKEQQVELVTLARDVYFHRPTNYFNLGSGANTIAFPFSTIGCNEIWTNDKPHVIYGYAIIDSNCTLTIEPGTEILFHQNAGLFVADFATLNVAQGAITGLSDSVIFMGDRLEPFYENVAGQWGGILGGIYVAQRAEANINLSTIKNAQTAIRVDSAVNPSQLTLSNSYILNSSRIGLRCGYSRVEATNTVIANSGLHCFYAFAGNYSFRHCTFANFFSESTRNTPAVLLTNFFEFQNDAGQLVRLIRDVESCYFGNSIITGNNNQEFSLATDMAGALNFQFNNALLKVESDPDDRGYDINDPSRFSSVLINRNALFVDTEKNFYDLDSGSAVINQGNTADALPLNGDILGRNRNVGLPDLGAYENQGN